MTEKLKQKKKPRASRPDKAVRPHFGPVKLRMSPGVQRPNYAYDQPLTRAERLNQRFKIIKVML